MLSREDREMEKRLRFTSRRPIPAGRPLLTAGPDAPALDDVDLWSSSADDEVIDDEAPVDAPVEPPGDIPPRRERRDPRSERAPRRIAPAWMDAPRAAIAERLRNLKHDSLFHLRRTPQYAGRALVYAPAGVHRTYSGIYRWASDAESAPARWLTSERGDVDGYLALTRTHDERVAERRPYALLLMLLPVLVAAAIGAGLRLPGLPLQARLVAGVALLVAIGWLGYMGAPEDKPLIESATEGPARRKITWTMLRAAFESDGVKLSKPRPDGAPPDPAREMTLIREIARDARDTGYVAVIDLPLGKTAADAMTKRDKIASGLSVGRAQVHITPDADSERRIHVYVADIDPFMRPRRESPLADVRQFNFWDAIPFGTNAKGEPVSLRMVWTHLLVAAIPRMGKTYGALLVAVAAALDPRVRLIVLNGKKGAWRHLAKVCHRYVAGARDEAVLYVLRTLRECVADMNNRGDLIEELDEKYGYGDKLTPEVANDPRYNMPLVLICIDEAQRYIGHHIYGDEIIELLLEIAKVGPSAGYMLVIAVQKPTGDVIPTDLRDNMGLRYVLRMKTSAGSKAALGEITPGYDPIQFADRHKGVGVLDGSDNEEDSLEGSDIDIVRTDGIDMALLEELADRAFAVRCGLSKLSGYAAGDDLPAESTPYLLLDHLSDAMGVGEKAVWSEELIRRIADKHPADYDGWSPDDLAAHLKPYGIKTVQIARTITDPETGEKQRVNRRGVQSDDLVRAYNREMAKRSTLGL